HSEEDPEQEENRLRQGIPYEGRREQRGPQGIEAARLDRAQDREPDGYAEIEREGGKAGRNADLRVLHRVLESDDGRRDHHPVTEAERDPDDDQLQERWRGADRRENHESRYDDRGTDEGGFLESDLRNRRAAQKNPSRQREGETVNDVPHIAHGAAQDGLGEQRQVGDDAKEHDGPKHVHGRCRGDISNPEEAGWQHRFAGPSFREP